MAATNIATKLNQSKYDKRFLSIENTKKENYLNQLIDVVEMKLQESELNDIVDREAVEQDSYKEAIINSSYQELDIIDSLFIKTNFVDEISANLIMDEIIDRTNTLESNLDALINIENSLTYKMIH